MRWFIERDPAPRHPGTPTPSPCAAGGSPTRPCKDTLRGTAGADRQRRGRRLPTLADGTWAARRRRWPGASPTSACRWRASACPERGCGCTADLERYLEHAAAGSESPLQPRAARAVLRAPGGGGERIASSRPSSSVTTSCCAGGSTASTTRPAGRRGGVSTTRAGAATLPSRWIGGGQGPGSAVHARRRASARRRTAVGGFYQPLSGRDLRGRGILDEDRDRPRRVRGDERPRAEECASCWPRRSLAARSSGREGAPMGSSEPKPESCSAGGWL